MSIDLDQSWEGGEPSRGTIGRINPHKLTGSRGIWIMAFEFPIRGSTLRLLWTGRTWAVEFNGRRRARWTLADDAVTAAVRHTTGLAEWDRTQFVVPDDLLRWRPIGENL